MVLFKKVKAVFIITRQDDRHLSNIAIKMSGESEAFYMLYDNGRSLFYGDTEEMVAQSVANPVRFATSFGYSGTYYDYVCEIAKERGGLNGIVNLDITKNDISDILKKRRGSKVIDLMVHLNGF